jgi:hypothetical protein
LPQPRRVAVIAVHGVADQEPDATCRQTGALLGRLSTESGDGCYTPFSEHRVDIPVHPLPVPSGHIPRGTFFYSTAVAAPGALDDQFLLGQLEDYEVSGEDASYHTLRLESRRIGRVAADDVDVHVYEMYWADLSRLSSGPLRILGELYQLLLHIGSLGKHAATGATAGDRSRIGRGFKLATTLAGWILAVPIGVFNLYMLGAALLPLAGVLGLRAQSYTAIVLATAMMTLAAGYGLLRYGKAPWPLSLAVLIGAGGGAFWLSTRATGEGARLLLGGALIVLASAVLLYFARWYRQFRPRSRHVSGPVLAGITAVMAASLVVERQSPAVLARAGFRAVEVLFVLLRLSWAAFLLLLWSAIAFGVAMWLRDRRTPQVGRAVWTSCLALGVAAYSIIVVTIVLWSGVWMTVGSTFIPLEPYTMLPVADFWLGSATDTRHFAETVLLASATPRFAITLSFFAVAMLVVGWALGPVVWSEVSPPGNNRDAAALGRWLNNAATLSSIGGGLVLFALLVVLPGGALVERLFAGSLFATSNEGVILMLGALVAAPAAGLLALPGRLKSLTAGFRSPLDIALDVDNYLREHPRRNPSRARQVARYWSLLNYVAGCGCDAIVVVAHSQGSVLSADLLRYIKRHDLGPLPPLYLFTMGNPLRQLYGERFPHLYEWAHHESSVPAALGEPIPDDQAPDPAALGIRRWVNAYRSGDYIGRWLWRADRFAGAFDAAGPEPAPWQPNPGLNTRVSSSDAAGTRREFCVGAGGHMHYWDGTAPEIAVELDALIADAR